MRRIAAAILIVLAIVWVALILLAGVAVRAGERIAKV